MKALGESFAEKVYRAESDYQEAPEYQKVSDTGKRVIQKTFLAEDEFNHANYAFADIDFVVERLELLEKADIFAYHKTENTNTN